mgnify:CR=1 FL=1
MNISEAKEITGTLATTSKMPCNSTSIPAKYCQTGSKLAMLDGSICGSCYGYSFKKGQAKGNYGFTNVKSSQEKRYLGITHPQWVEAMVKQILVASIVNETNYFRVHDLGDIQSLEHLENWVEVAKRLPDIKFWMPTRELQYLYAYTKKHGNIWPENLTIRLSETFIRNHPNANVKNVESNIAAMERHAAILNVNISGVDRKPDHSVTEKKLFTCQAYKAKANKGTNACGDCRACWDKTVVRVIYPEH